MTEKRKIELFAEKIKELPFPEGSMYLVLDDPRHLINPVPEEELGILLDGWITIQNLERIIQEVYCSTGETSDEDSQADNGEQP